MVDFIIKEYNNNVDPSKKWCNVEILTVKVPVRVTLTQIYYTSKKI